MSWSVDAHVHYQECFGWPRFLRAARENLVRHRRPETQAGCLLFADLAGRSSRASLERFWEDPARGSSPADAWSLRSTEESVALRLEADAGLPLLLVFGRQIATREGLEVLAAGPRSLPPDGLDLEETVRACLDQGALTIVPWGFGKWWFGRGRLVSRLLEGELASRICLGDNGNRSAWGPPPGLFEEAWRCHIPILAGSDPLPLTHHARRVLSYGFRLEGDLDLQRPVASLRGQLDRRADRLPTFGRLAGPVRFLTDQLRMQLHTRRRLLASHPQKLGSKEGPS